MMWFITHADTAAGSIVIAGVYVKIGKWCFWKWVLLENGLLEKGALGKG